ncbi:dUTPase, partial [Bacillus cereus]
MEMNLTKIFGMQKVLDTRIVKEHGLEGKNLFYNMILALQVEIGELA